MVRSIDPRRVTLRQFRWPFKVVALLGTRVAETILASGHVRPHEKAAHMEASDPIEDISKKLLASGSRPHMELQGQNPDGVTIPSTLNVDQLAGRNRSLSHETNLPASQIRQFVNNAGNGG